ncbi:unnamed protein product [Mytilus coruscus]|uniref:Uncharacterized protein n=1 Tax=Mytilus coruscus TaxID=42192 RepID=A0A6J8BSK3_MYTCO|nr:unnamed protein product [Mytilus coruscus]
MLTQKKYIKTEYQELCSHKGISNTQGLESHVETKEINGCKNLNILPKVEGRNGCHHTILIKVEPTLCCLPYHIDNMTHTIRNKSALHLEKLRQSDQTGSFGTTSLAKASESDRFRDVTDADIDSFLQEQLNKNTSKKTKSDLKIFQLFLKSKHDEKRNIEQIPPQQLDRYLSFFFLSATKEKQTNGTFEYEPSSLKSIQQSISRHLKDNEYECNIIIDDEFHKKSSDSERKNLKT